MNQNKPPALVFILSGVWYQQQEKKMINTFIYLVGKYFIIYVICSHFIPAYALPPPPGLEPTASSQVGSHSTTSPFGDFWSKIKLGFADYPIQPTW